MEIHEKRHRKFDWNCHWAGACVFTWHNLFRPKLNSWNCWKKLQRHKTSAGMSSMSSGLATSPKLNKKEWQTSMQKCRPFQSTPSSPSTNPSPREGSYGSCQTGILTTNVTTINESQDKLCPAKTSPHTQQVQLQRWCYCPLSKMFYLRENTAASTNV